MNLDLLFTGGVGYGAWDRNFETRRALILGMREATVNQHPTIHIEVRTFNNQGARPTLGDL